MPHIALGNSRVSILGRAEASSAATLSQIWLALRARGKRGPPGRSLALTFERRVSPAKAMAAHQPSINSEAGTRSLYDPQPFVSQLAELFSVLNRMSRLRQRSSPLSKTPSIALSLCFALRTTEALCVLSGNGRLLEQRHSARSARVF